MNLILDDWQAETLSGFLAQLIDEQDGDHLDHLIPVLEQLSDYFKE